LQSAAAGYKKKMVCAGKGVLFETFPHFVKLSRGIFQGIMPDLEIDKSQVTVADL